MQVREVMTPQAECTRPDASLQEAARRMKELDVGSLPVCGDDDRLAGMITDRDITIRAVADGLDVAEARVDQTMTPEVIYCYDDQEIDEAAQLMKDRQVRRLVVLNRDKRLTGILSLGDVAVDGPDDLLTGNTLERISEPAEPRR